MSLTIDEVNELSYEDFTQIFGNVVERCPFLTASIWNKIPFESIEHMNNDICKTIEAFPEDVQVGMLRCLPDLAGKLTKTGGLARDSTAEQTSSGLMALTLEEQTIMDEFNMKYKKKFQFPFVVCARKNKKDAILKGILERVNNDIGEEIKTAIEEVKKIGYLRLCYIIKF